MNQYVVDESGRKKAVILDLDEFNRLIEHIEEIEDALDLKKATEAGGDFLELKDFVAELRKENRL